MDTTFCTCNHQLDEHRWARGACTGPDSYGLPCACPSFEPDPNTVDLDLDAAREQALLAGDDLPPR